MDEDLPAACSRGTTARFSVWRRSARQRSPPPTLGLESWSFFGAWSLGFGVLDVGARPRGSFVTQCDNRINPGGPARRQETGQSGDEREQACDRQVDRRIEWIHFE